MRGAKASIGPIIQPMSLNQKTRSAGCTSKSSAMSCDTRNGKPACVCTVPLGVPDVPDV